MLLADTFFPHAEKYFTILLHSCVKYFSAFKEILCTSTWPCNILDLLYCIQINQSVKLKETKGNFT